MNGIAESQNAPRQIELLAAQRQLYADAKAVFATQLILSGPVAVVWAFTVMLYPTLKGWGALWGVVVAVCDLVWLTPWQKRLKERAAKTQELFDCGVLSLPWNDVKAGRPPDPELVFEHSKRYGKWARKMPPLTNWYSTEVQVLPLHLARIACQRSNCWWDAKQRRRYACWVLALVTVISLLVLIFGFARGLTLEDFTLTVVAPLAPMLLLGGRQYAEQLESADRLDRMKEHAERLWNDALSGKLEVEIAARSRNLQDELYEHRKRGPVILDKIFRWLRRDLEEQMNKGSAALVEEARRHLGDS